MAYIEMDSGVVSGSERTRYRRTDEGAFSMKSHRSLRYMIVWTGRSPGRHRREPQPGVARTQATRGIVVPALVLASLGAAAGIAAGQSAGNQVHATAHPAAQSQVSSNHPWIY
jgi:hypothetical protein